MTYKAFVSSTFEDLEKHRKEVIISLRKAGIFVDPMEEWTAASNEPKKFSQDRIKGCDLCVLLVGFRRGHVPQGEESSITQLEYQAALSAGIDVLVFMLKEQSPWPHKFYELDKDPGIRQWRAELKESKGVGFFGLEPSSIEIAPALVRWIAEKKKSSGSRRIVASTTSPRVVTQTKMADRMRNLVGRRLDRREWIRLLDEIIPDQISKRVLLAVTTQAQGTFNGYAEWSGGTLEEPVYGFVGPEKQRFNTPLSKIDAVEVLRVD